MISDCQWDATIFYIVGKGDLQPRSCPRFVGQGGGAARDPVVVPSMEGQERSSVGILWLSQVCGMRRRGSL